MAKHIVARASEIPDGGRVLVTVQGRSIGVFNIEGRFYALLNRCPHRGAELCRGSILGHLEAAAPGERRWTSARHMLQCPWHGWEYDIETGQSYTASSARRYPVEVEPGEAVRCEMEAGEATPVSTEGPAPIAGTGFSGPMLRPGPFVADTFPITVEDDYVIVSLPTRSGAGTTSG